MELTDAVKIFEQNLIFFLFISWLSVFLPEKLVPNTCFIMFFWLPVLVSSNFAHHSSSVVSETIEVRVNGGTSSKNINFRVILSAI